MLRLKAFVDARPRIAAAVDEDEALQVELEWRAERLDGLKVLTLALCACVRMYALFAYCVLAVTSILSSWSLCMTAIVVF